MLVFRKATIEDLELYYDWANDKEVRHQSYNSNKIKFESHKEWFLQNLADTACLLLIFQNYAKENIGQVRIQQVSPHDSIIGISIASEHRKKNMPKK